MNTTHGTIELTGTYTVVEFEHSRSDARTKLGRRVLGTKYLACLVLSNGHRINLGVPYGFATREEAEAVIERCKG